MRRTQGADSSSGCGESVAVAACGAIAGEAWQTQQQQQQQQQVCDHHLASQLTPSGRVSYATPTPRSQLVIKPAPGMSSAPATDDNPDQAMVDAQCVKLTLQRARNPLPASAAFAASFSHTVSYVKALWLQERKMLEELIKLEATLEKLVLERKRANRALRRRTRRLAQQRRDIQVKQKSLDTYHLILAAPVNRKPQTIEEDEDEEATDESERDGGDDVGSSGDSSSDKL